MPRAAANADQLAAALDGAMERFGINTPTGGIPRPDRARVGAASALEREPELHLGAVAQSFSNYFPTDAAARAFARQPERIATRVYGGRLGNGPEASGHGWRYRGRGPIQLTGKSNYRACGTGIGLDLVNQPELLETPEVGCLAAAWFWATKGLNELADAGEFRAMTQRINGGLIGLEDRQAFWERAKAVFGVAAAPSGASRARRRRPDRGAGRSVVPTREREAEPSPHHGVERDDATYAHREAKARSEADAQQGEASAAPRPASREIDADEAADALIVHQGEAGSLRAFGYPEVGSLGLTYAFPYPADSDRNSTRSVGKASAMSVVFQPSSIG